MNMIEYPSRDALMEDVAIALAADLRAALEQKDTVSFAVPGGTTPGPVFDALCAIDLDWSRVHILLSDERWVPERNPQSNAALIRKRLLTGHAATAQFTPYFRADMDSTSAASALSVELSGLAPIDVLLLGMGADMHTASLFPGSDGLADALAEDAQMLLPISIEGQDVQRFTLTAPFLRSAKATHVLITGEDKRQAITQAQNLSPAEAPIQTVLSNATVHWSAT
ncbi:6-phosphogluconolactonase [Sulfitobacter sp.]|uniref:6-phosphogluconolactonase n=1 Tax=Sulfitobacter sp. TaxID=1903071 RepID=UPI0030017683